MTVSIFTDPSRNAAVLVNDDPLYALGPVMVADDPAEAVTLIEAFLDALGAPADSMPTIGLMTEWQGFLIAFHGLMSPPPEGSPDGDSVAATAESEPEPAAVLPASSEAEEASEALTAEQVLAQHQDDVAPIIGPEPPVEEPGGDEDEDEGELPAEELHQRLQNVPNGTPAQRGEVDCWACGGEGKTPGPDGPMDCPVCQGAGKVPATA